MTTVARPTAVRRLRPGVAVTPLRAGLHLRGRGGSVTLEGSDALPALWKLLEGPLRQGGLEALLDGIEPGSALRRALDTLLGQLTEHGLLATGDAASGPVGQWLAESTGRPADQAAALAAARAEVLAGDPDAPLARAAGRALADGGLAVAYTADPDLPGDRVLLRVHGAGPDRAVAAGRCGVGGYATAPGSPAQARADARALEARLGPAGPAGPAAFPPLLAGAAAHRLLCAAAGLADPAAEGGDERLLPGLPAVLLADARPLRADYRTWLGPERLDPDRRTGLAPARTLREALRRLDALGDGRCGVLPGPEPAELGQLPVPLAACAVPRGRLTGGAPRLDLARLELFCRVAELALGEGEFTVGANPRHARGRALRAAAARRTGGAVVSGEAWSAHPQARHWWATLTGRLGVPARLELVRAAPAEEVYHALIHGPLPSAPGPAGVLGEAVEATPGDAVAFAALSAVSAATAPTLPAAPTASAAPSGSAAPAAPAGTAVPAVPARAVVPAGLAVPAGSAVPVGPAVLAAFAGPADRGGSDAPRVPPSGGAVAPLAVAGARIAAWEDTGWTNGWMADVAAREERFQAALHRLTGASFRGARGLSGCLEAADTVEISGAAGALGTPGGSGRPGAPDSTGTAVRPGAPGTREAPGTRSPLELPDAAGLPVSAGVTGLGVLLEAFGFVVLSAVFEEVR